MVHWWKCCRIVVPSRCQFPSSTRTGAISQSACACSGSGSLRFSSRCSPTDVEGWRSHQELRYQVCSSSASPPWRVLPAVCGCEVNVSEKADISAELDDERSACCVCTRRRERFDLDRWLTNPSQLVPGARMYFKIDDAKSRADVIAYLEQLK